MKRLSANTPPFHKTQHNTERRHGPSHSCSQASVRIAVQHDPEGRPVPTHYLVLEFCDGGDLQEFLEARRRGGARGVDEATARRLLRMLALGLREMHARNIVHVRSLVLCTIDFVICMRRC